MQYKKEQCEKKINLCRQKLRKLPPGNLYITKNGHHFKWYSYSADKSEYISKKDRAHAEQLAYRKYLTYLLQESEQEKKAIELYMKCCPSDSPLSLNLLSDPEYQSLLSPFLTPISKELQDWITSPYSKSDFHPENLNIKAISGNYVRSKSEAMIDMFLTTNQIPFRYECPLIFAEKTIYPDFTIRHPKTGDFYYWEHFGLMDDSEYCNSAMSKLKLYTSCGIIPMIRLITTYETQTNPLSPFDVEYLVKRFFLE